ncbi:MAG: hypothetical protein AVO39_01120 [delta proteobacterium MLS_D]|jgi:DNA primase|nr:MAG: hypothetical protein AVO39_01120 [delta proteobacterium MLS_D]
MEMFRIVPPGNAAGSFAEGTAGKAVTLKGHIPQDVIEEIRSRSNIVELVSEYVTLKKAGKNYVGLCPFHQEKTPSFTVNPDKQICYCFGCGEGGNEISFLMKIQNISFPEAVRKLAARRGIVIPEERPAGGERRRDEERAGLIKVNRLAQGFFEKNMMSGKGKQAREYLAGRGMSDSVVKTFALGYAPEGWRNLRDHLTALRVPDELLRKSGLVVFKNERQVYDRFRNRIIFPIENLSGEIVAFGGRELGGGEPKYLNSPETPLYVKGDNLYGLFRTKDEIRSKDMAILVEGYFDLLALWNAGVQNVFATLGTALTRRQASLIGRFTRNVALLFDGDAAGRAAVERSLPLFLEEGIAARVVILPDGSDPDDYVRKYGRESLEGLIHKAPTMVDYYIDGIMNNADRFEGTTRLARETIAFIRNIPDVIQRNLFIKRCAEKLGLDQGMLKEEVNRESRRGGPAVPERRPGSTVDPVELYLLYLMIEFPRKIPFVRESGILECCNEPALRTLGGRIVEIFEKRGTVTMAEIMNEQTEGGVTDRLLAMAVNDPPEEAIVDRMFHDTMKKIKTHWYRERHRALKRRLVEAHERRDAQQCDNLLMEKAQLLNQEQKDHILRGEQ